MSRLYLEPAKVLQPIKLNTDNGIDRIIRAVCEEFRTTPKRLFQRTRKQEVMDPYYAAFKLLNELTDLHYVKLMELVGRDRTNYYPAVKASNNLFDTDKTFREKVMRIWETITNEENKRNYVRQRFLSYAKKRYRSDAITGRFDRQSDTGALGRFWKSNRLRVAVQSQRGAMLRNQRGLIQNMWSQVHQRLHEEGN